MRPDSVTAFSIGETVAQDDPRRVRAVMTAVLRDAAKGGDSLLPLSDTIDRVRSRFPDRRACHPDREVVLAKRDFHAPTVKLEDGARVVSSLTEIADAELLVRDAVMSRVRRARGQSSQVDWGKLFDAWLQRSGGHKHSEEFETRARVEKVSALETLFGERFTVLTGRAGTGKTSVLQVLLEGIEQAEGKAPVLLLAPTGKARVRLAERTKRDAQTIHQLLLRQG